MIASVHLTGHLTPSKLSKALEKVPAGDEPFTLLVNCLDMVSYDAETRHAFVAWNSQHASRIEKVAVVTNRRIWHMVISAMGFASRQHMRPFDNVTNAHTWLTKQESLRPAAH